MADKRLADGQTACAFLDPGEGPPRARRVELLGALDDPQTPIRAAEVRYSLDKTFPPEVEKEATSFGAEPGEEDLRGREDFRALPTVTIDPEDAKDFDDALSIRPEGKGFRLWVHIADVSHYVRPGTALDREAERRGNSVYLPGTVYPMLPHALSSTLCSLVPDRDRLTFTAEMLVDGRGRVHDARYHKGVIRSMARLSYSGAQAILEGREHSAPEVAILLRDALALQKILFGRRLSLGTSGPGPARGGPALRPHGEGGGGPPHGPPGQPPHRGGGHARRQRDGGQGAIPPRDARPLSCPRKPQPRET